MPFKNSNDDYICWKCGRISAAHENRRIHRFWCHQGYIAEYWIEDRWVRVHGQEVKWTVLFILFLLFGLFIDYTFFS
jgi:hypothetical protein